MKKMPKNIDSINIGRIPAAKRIAISVCGKNWIHPIAYFTKDEYADWFMKLARRGFKASGESGVEK